MILCPSVLVQTTGKPEMFVDLVGNDVGIELSGPEGPCFFFQRHYGVPVIYGAQHRRSA